MKTAFFLFPLIVLAGCSSEPAPEPTPTATATAPVGAPPLAAPDQALFTRLYAATCPDAEPVSTAVCKRAGFGSEEVTCEYGLGEDKYLRNKATLVPAEDEWAVKDGAAICTPAAEPAAG